MRDRAVLILRSITGKQMGYEATAPEKQREAAIERWANWFKANRADLVHDPESGLITGAS